METLDIDPSALADVVRRMPGHAGYAPGRWGVEPIAYRIINRGVTAGLYRVAGDAADDRGRPWSLVVKVLRRAADEPSSAFNASDDPAHWNYWRREALVYTSGLLGRCCLFFRDCLKRLLLPRDLWWETGLEGAAPSNSPFQIVS